MCIFGHPSLSYFIDEVSNRSISTMNLLPAIVFGGPPHAGKSVLFYSIAKTLQDHHIRYHAIRACPDGEGNWFHELDQEKVRSIRVKGTWTDDFVRRIALDIERRHLPLLVDMGGYPSEQQTLILSHCTHSLLLLRPDEEQWASQWRHIVKVRGLLPLAELTSELDGTSTITSEGPIITGTLTGLKRGSLAHGPLFDALVRRIELLFSSYSLEELERMKLDLAPVELVVNLEALLQGWPSDAKRWESTMLPRLLSELPAETPLAVYGRGPNWVYAALAAHAGQQPFYQFDPRLGWVTPPLLKTGHHPASEIQIQQILRTYQDVTLLSMRIMDAHLDYLQADQCAFPPVPAEHGV